MQVLVGAKRWSTVAVVLGTLGTAFVAPSVPTARAGDAGDADGRRQLFFDVPHQHDHEHPDDLQRSSARPDRVGPAGGMFEQLSPPSSGVLLAGMNPVSPGRLLDTRDGTGVTAPGALAGGTSIDLLVLGREGVPESGVDAVAVNIVVTDATEPSYLTVWPTGVDRPLTSSHNMAPGQTVANLVFAKVGDKGSISIFNGFGSAHVIADVVGWSGEEAFLHSLTPARILDTRNGTGSVAPGAVGATGRVDLTVTGGHGVPDTGVESVVLNVTVTEATAPSFVTVWPNGADRPLASNLNTLPGETNPNLVVAEVGAEGKVSLFNAAGSAHLVVDIVGWMPAGGAYRPIAPTRVLDTRDGTGIFGHFFDDPTFGRILRPRQIDADPRIGADETIELQVAYPLDLPPSATAVLLNLTGIEATEPTYLTAWGSGAPRPLASSLNLAPGAARPNLVLAEVGVDGFTSLYNLAGQVHVVADVVGYFEARNADDAVDEVTGPQVHVVHAVPSDVTAAYGDDEIRHVLDVAEGWLEDMGGRGIRFDSDGGAIEITTVQMSKTSAELVASADPYTTDWDDWIRADGLGMSGKAYLVFIEGAPTGGLCGLGGNGQARVFTSSCFPEDSGSIPRTTGDWRTLSSARTALHELTHVLGAVAWCAPSAAGGGHVSDVGDLMYYSQFITSTGELDPAYGINLDTGSDDYWGQRESTCFGDPWPDISLSPYLDEPRLP